MTLSDPVRKVVLSVELAFGPTIPRYGIPGTLVWPKVSTLVVIGSAYLSPTLPVYWMRESRMQKETSTAPLKSTSVRGERFPGVVAAAKDLAHSQERGAACQTALTSRL